MNVSLIITTFNRFDALELVLKSIESQVIKPLEVIIADDGSDENNVSKIKEFINNSQLNIIHSWQENIGFRLARSRNKAISLSTGEYLIVIDGDMILHPYFVADHILAAKKNFFIQGSRVLIQEKLTEKLLNKEISSVNFFSRDIANRKNTIRSRLLSKFFSEKNNSHKRVRGCNMSFYKSDCIAVNGFNNEFEGWGREDSEFVVRFLNAGFYKKNLKFSAVQFHLWHGLEENKSLPENDKILDNTINKNLSWCEFGINEFLD